MSSPADVATAIQSYVETLSTAFSNPSDAVNAFKNLVAAMPQPVAIPQSEIATSQQVVASALSDLCRRYAVGQLAQASALYQPASYDDAANIRTVVCSVIDGEIDIAGDQGEDATYLALKKLRQLVVQDLTSRGATLAALATFKFGGSMPSLALAQRIYQDPNRNDQLVAFANPRHPGFMPHQFNALSR